MTTERPPSAIDAVRSWVGAQFSLYVTHRVAPFLYHQLLYDAGIRRWKRWWSACHVCGWSIPKGWPQ